MADLKISAATPNPAPAGTDNFATDKAGADFRTSLAQVNAFILANAGDVFKVGTPANDQIGVWTGDGTIEGTAGLRFDGSQLILPNYSLPNPDGTAGQVLTTDGAGVVSFIDQARGGGLLSATYLFDTDTTAADPGPGNVRFNNATPASVTAIYIDAIDENAVDVTNILSLITTNDRIYIQTKEDASEFLVFNVSAPITDNTGWFTITGTVQASGGLPADGEESLVVLQIGGAATGGGDVFKVGTPANNQLGIWTGDGTIEGDANLLWNTANLQVASAGGQFEGGVTTSAALRNVATTISVPTLIPNRQALTTGIGSGAIRNLSVICDADWAQTWQHSTAADNSIRQFVRITSGITANVTQTQGNGLINGGRFSEVTTVANEDDVITLHNPAAGSFLITIINSGANRLQIFPPVGDTILGNALNASVFLDVNRSMTFYTVDASNWAIISEPDAALAFPLLAPNGSAAAPSYSFASDSSEGMYYDGQVKWAALGTEVMRMDDTGLLGPSGGSPTWYLVSDELASNTNPIYTFNNNNGTGMGGGGDGTVSLIADHIEYLRISDEGAAFVLSGTDPAADGGLLSLLAGASGVGATGDGGGINIFAGASVATAGDGGDVDVKGGAGFFTGKGGDIHHEVGSGGAAGPGTSGNYFINTTVGLTADGGLHVPIPGLVSIYGLSRSGAGPAGNLELWAGYASGGGAGSDGGDLLLFGGGQGGGAGLGGNAHLYGGESDADPGFAEVEGGTATVAGQGGGAFLKGGPGFGGNSGGGSATVQGGVGVGTGFGGSAVIVGGSSGPGATGGGGNVDLKGGVAGSTNGDGGDILLEGGDASGSGETGAIIINPASPGVATEFRFREINAGANYVGFVAAASLSGDQIWTLPVGDSTNTQALVSDGAGVLSWADIPVVNDVVQARRTTVLTLTTAYVDVTMDATDVETDPAVIDHDDITTDDINVSVAGTYEITYDVDVETAETSGSLLITMDGRIRLNNAGTGIAGSDARCGSFRDTSLDGEHFNNHLSCTFVATLAVDDFITLQLRKTELAGAGSGVFDSIRQSVKVRRLT